MFFITKTSMIFITKTISCIPIPKKTSPTLSFRLPIHHMVEPIIASVLATGPNLVACFFLFGFMIPADETLKTFLVELIVDQG